MTCGRGRAMAARVHRLFFALQPDAAALGAVARVVEQAKTVHDIRGRWLAPEKLHVTVQFLGDFTSADEIASRAGRAAGALRVAPFDFTFDRLATFPRRFQPPCILRCAPGSEATLQELARELGTALRAAGLGEYVETRLYVPHLTIAYAQSALPEPLTIEPIVWRARAVCLIDSHGGQHVQIGDWPLRA